MKTKDLAEILEQMQAQLAALSERMELLEKAAPKPKEKTLAAPAPKLPPSPPKPDISEEELIVVSAALGAYFGFRVHIKQIRLLSSPAWAQQGRVSIQASHKLHN
jgi:methylmalonyl-CoA carboxyltransferase 12S subunit